MLPHSLPHLDSYRSSLDGGGFADSDAEHALAMNRLINQPSNETENCGDSELPFAADNFPFHLSEPSNSAQLMQLQNHSSRYAGFNESNQFDSAVFTSNQSQSQHQPQSQTRQQRPSQHKHQNYSDVSGLALGADYSNSHPHSHSHPHDSHSHHTYDSPNYSADSQYSSPILYDSASLIDNSYPQQHSAASSHSPAVLSSFHSLVPRLSFPFSIHFRHSERQLAGRQLFSPLHISVRELIRVASQLDSVENVSIEQFNSSLDSNLIEIPGVLKRFLHSASLLSAEAIDSLPLQAEPSRPISLNSDSPAFSAEKSISVLVEVDSSVKACSRLGCLNFLVKRASRRTCDACQRSGYDIDKSLLVQVSLFQPHQIPVNPLVSKEIQQILEISLGRADFWKFESSDENSFIIALADDQTAESFHQRMNSLFSLIRIRGKHSTKAGSATNSANSNNSMQLSHSIAGESDNPIDRSNQNHRENSAESDDGTMNIAGSRNSKSTRSESNLSAALSKIPTAEFSSPKFFSILSQLGFNSEYDYSSHYLRFSSSQSSFSIRMKSHFWCLSVSDRDPVDGRLTLVASYRKIGKPNQKRSNVKKNDSPQQTKIELIETKQNSKKRPFPQDHQPSVAGLDSSNQAWNSSAARVPNAKSSGVKSVGSDPTASLPPLSESPDSDDHELEPSTSTSDSSNGFDSNSSFQLKREAESDGASESHSNSNQAASSSRTTNSPPLLHSSPFTEFDEKEVAIGIPSLTDDEEIHSIQSTPQAMRELAASNSLILSHRGFDLLQRGAIAATMNVYSGETANGNSAQKSFELVPATPVILVYRGEFNQRNDGSGLNSMGGLDDEPDDGRSNRGNSEGSRENRPDSSRDSSAHAKDGNGGNQFQGGESKRPRQNAGSNNDPNDENFDKSQSNTMKLNSQISVRDSLFDVLMKFQFTRFWFGLLLFIGLATVSLLILNGLNVISSLNLLVQEVDHDATHLGLTSLQFQTENDVAALRLISSSFDSWARIHDPTMGEGNALADLVVQRESIYTKLFSNTYRASSTASTFGTSSIASRFSVGFLADRCLDAAQVAFGIGDWILFVNDLQHAFAYRNSGNSNSALFPEGADDFCGIMDNPVGRAYLKSTMCASIGDQDFLIDLCADDAPIDDWSRPNCVVLMQETNERNLTNLAFLADSDGLLHTPIYPVSIALDFYQQSQTLTPSCGRMRSRSLTIDNQPPVYQYRINYVILSVLLFGSSALIILFLAILFAAWKFSPQTPKLPPLSFTRLFTAMFKRRNKLNNNSNPAIDETEMA